MINLFANACRWPMFHFSFFIFIYSLVICHFVKTLNSNDNRAFAVRQISKKLAQLFVDLTHFSNHSSVNFNDRSKLSHRSGAENLIGHIKFRQRNISLVERNLMVLTKPQNIQPRNPFRARNSSRGVHNAVLDHE
jgi:hypothetical protein